MIRMTPGNPYKVGAPSSQRNDLIYPPHIAWYGKLLNEAATEEAKQKTVTVWHYGNPTNCDTTHYRVGSGCHIEVHNHSGRRKSYAIS